MARGVDLSVIIPVAPGASPARAIRAVRRSIPAGIRAELLTITGSHPTRQRNLAVMRARGEAIYFLDHDACAAPGTVTSLLRALRQPGTVAAGGPNLAAPPRTAFERRAAETIASPAGSAAVIDRYSSSGHERPATERSLILCNLAMRRRALLAAGGFDPRLYPNEENDLLNRMLRDGATACHVPGAIVVKPRAATLAAFLRESFRYGRGRAEQVWVGGRAGDARMLGGGVFSVLRAAGSALALARLAAWGTGFIVGALAGWHKRRVRLTPMPAGFRRYDVRPGRMPRLIETAVFNLGAMSKGGYAIA